MAKKSNSTSAAVPAADPIAEGIENAFAVGNYAAVRTLARKAEASGNPSAIHRAHQKLALINVDITPDPEVHVHRVGRTGRAGESGLALSLATMNEMGSVGKIEQYQNAPSVWYKLEDLVPASNKPLLPPMACLQILGGRKEKIRPGDVLGALTADAGYSREQIGKIVVTEFTTFVAVQRDIALQAMQKLNAGSVKGKSVKVRLL